MKLLKISTNSWGFHMEILWKPYENACGFHRFFIGIALVVQSVENRAISEHVSYFEAVPRTFAQDCSSLFCIDPRVWYPIIMMALQNNAFDWPNFLLVRLSVWSCLRTLIYKVPAQAGVYAWCFFIKESKLFNVFCRCSVLFHGNSLGNGGYGRSKFKA